MLDWGCTHFDHTYPTGLTGRIEPGVRCRCGKRIWGGSVESVRVCPECLMKWDHKTDCSRSRDCHHTFDRDGDLGVETCTQCGTKLKRKVGADVTGDTATEGYGREAQPCRGDAPPLAEKD